MSGLPGLGVTCSTGEQCMPLCYNLVTAHC